MKELKQYEGLTEQQSVVFVYCVNHRWEAKRLARSKNSHVELSNCLVPDLMTVNEWCCLWLKLWKLVTNMNGSSISEESPVASVQTARWQSPFLKHWLSQHVVQEATSYGSRRRSN
jgi:hypothetical protein